MQNSTLIHKMIRKSPLAKGIPSVALELWDGTVLPASGPEQARVIVSSPRALRSLLFPTPLSIGEAYVQGELDVDGDIDLAIAGSAKLFAHQGPRLPGFLRSTLALLVDGNHHRERRVELKGARYARGRTNRAISYHYDLPVEFWQAWLDQSLAYSCAYFEKGDEVIDVAQENKYNYICKKLQLNHDESLLDLGCGWGGLAIHAARYFSARAVGVTLSEKQASYATDKARRLGLGDRCSIIHMDLRDYRHPDGFDKVASVGAVEHFGARSLPQFFSAAWDNLRAGGLFLCHGITSRQVESGRHRESFTDKYLFPDYQLSPVHLLLSHAQTTGFEIRDVEGLREHYVLTFERWCRRLEDAQAKVIDLVGEVTYRIFRLSLRYMGHCHRSGSNGLHQLLLAKPANGRVALPLTRRQWYV